MTVINKRYDDAVIGMVNWTHRWYREGASGMPSAAEIGRSFIEVVLNGLSLGDQPPDASGLPGRP